MRNWHAVFDPLENNEARSEPAALAREIDIKTQAAWHGHPRQLVFDNNGSDFEDKLQARMCTFHCMTFHCSAVQCSAFHRHRIVASVARRTTMTTTMTRDDGDDIYIYPADRRLGRASGRAADDEPLVAQVRAAFEAAGVRVRGRGRPHAALLRRQDVRRPPLSCCFVVVDRPPSVTTASASGRPV